MAGQDYHRWYGRYGHDWAGDDKGQRRAFIHAHVHEPLEQWDGTYAVYISGDTDNGGNEHGI